MTREKRRNTAAKGAAGEPNTMFYLAMLLLVIVLSAILSFAIVAKFKKPIGTDFASHLRSAAAYLEGPGAIFSNEAAQSNSGPYPPLFHLVLAAMLYLGMIKPFALLMQAIIYPAIFATTAWLLLKKKGAATAAFAVLLMFASRALFDRAQVIPQSIDIMLFPLAIYMFLEKRTAWFIALMCIMIYSHGAYAFLLLGALVLAYAWKHRTSWAANRRQMLLYTVLASIPILVLTLAFLPGLFAVQSQTGATYNKQVILEHPYYIIKLLGWPLVLAVAGSIYYWHSQRKSLDPLDCITLCWLALLIPVLIVMPDRWPSYTAVPLAILGAKTLAGMAGRRSWAGAAAAVAILAAGLLTNYREAWLLFTGVTGYTFSFGV